jgi:biopolymer transport protein ExbD
MRSKVSDQENEVDVQMTPLIDCVFLLLVFFLVAATLKKPHKELEIQLPHSAAASVVASKYDTLIIEMTKDGDIYIETEPMTKHTLLKKLELVYEETPNRRVRIDADRRTPAQYIVRLLDQLQFKNLNNVGIRTRDE